MTTLTRRCAGSPAISRSMARIALMGVAGRRMTRRYRRGLWLCREARFATVGVIALDGTKDPSEREPLRES